MVIHFVTALTSRVIGSRGCRGGAPRPAAPVSASSDHDSAAASGQSGSGAPVASARAGVGSAGVGSAVGSAGVGSAVGSAGVGSAVGSAAVGSAGVGSVGVGSAVGSVGVGSAVGSAVGSVVFGRMGCPGGGIGGSGRNGGGDVHARGRLRFGGDRPGNRFRPGRYSLLGVGVWGGAGLGVHGLFGVLEARHPGVGLLGPGLHLCGPGPQLGQPRLGFGELLPLVPHGQLPGDHEAEQSTDEESGQPAERGSEQSPHHGCQHDHNAVLQVSDRRFSLARLQRCRLARHVGYPAGSARVLISRNSSNPATPISRPMPDCL